MKGYIGILVGWICFYLYWTVYTFFVIPPTGDVVYFLFCLFAWMGMIYMPFTFPRPAEPVAAKKAKASKPTKHHTLTEWRALCDRYQHRCLCCKKAGTPGNPITKDHVIPQSKGGVDTIDNIQPLCKSCNSRKKDKHIDYR